MMKERESAKGMYTYKVPKFKNFTIKIMKIHERKILLRCKENIATVKLQEHVSHLRCFNVCMHCISSEAYKPTLLSVIFTA